MPRILRRAGRRSIGDRSMNRKQGDDTSATRLEPLRQSHLCHNPLARFHELGFDYAISDVLQFEHIVAGTMPSQ